MAALSRIGDSNSAGGVILRGAATVLAEGRSVGLHSSSISPHAPYGDPHPPHRAASTTNGSPTVFADGSPVLRVGSGVTCGHGIATGCGTVFVP